MYSCNRGEDFRLFESRDQIKASAVTEAGFVAFFLFSDCAYSMKKVSEFIPRTYLSVRMHWRRYRLTGVPRLA